MISIGTTKSEARILSYDTEIRNRIELPVESDRPLLLNRNSLKVIQLRLILVLLELESCCLLVQFSLPGCVKAQRSPNEQSGIRLQAVRIDPGGLSAKLLSWSLCLLPYAPDCGLLCEYLHAVPNLHVLVSSKRLHLSLSQSLQHGPLHG